MGSSEKTDYCAFTKAVEHFGDRWSLLIVRELAQFGPQGFNTLATGLPGKISRSVLASRLRKLEELELIARIPSGRGRPAAYALAPAGEQLVPTLMSLWQWAEAWVPENPAVAQRDPAVIMWWLRHRVEARRLPSRQVVIQLTMTGTQAGRSWLLLAAGAEPTICEEDPLLGEDRYVYVEAGVADLYAVARGLRSWSDAMHAGAVQVFGEPDLVAALPGWFLATDSALAAAS